MSERRWWPAEYTDEVMPLHRNDPSDWIAVGKHGYFLVPAEIDTSPEQWQEPQARLLVVVFAGASEQ